MGERRGTGKPGRNDNHPMNNSRIHLAALLALLVLGMGLSGTGTAAPGARSKAARTPSKSPAAIALIADRKVEEADIQRAALVLAGDPLRSSGRAAWRKKLLDLCVDRELLAMEAERAGFVSDPSVRQKIERAGADVLYDVIRDRYLLPAATPTAAQIDTARAGGLFRRVKLSYILSVSDRKTTYALMEAIKHGASFDSIAALYSVHPSAAKGGEVGWRRVGQLNAGAWRLSRTAKPGDLMGPYANAQAHEFYQVEEIADPSDDEIRDVMMKDPLREMKTRYEVGLLQKYHFTMIPDAVSSVLFASATEKTDSILASLDAAGFRPKRDIHPPLGTIATVDGDSISYRDLAFYLIRDEEGKAHIDDSRELIMLSSTAMLPRLIARDARERGVDKDPAAARRLRLIREEISTRAMVARAVPAPDSTAVRAWFAAHASRYQRPPARRVLVAVFASRDTARLALASWTRAASRDSTFAVEGFRRATRPTATGIYPRFYGEVSVFDTEPDPLSVGVRGLDEGQISSLLETPNGYAVAQSLGREPARPYTFDEVRIRAAAEAREDAENTWVVRQLERLRAATPARTVPARLDAVRLGLATETGGNRR